MNAASVSESLNEVHMELVKSDVPESFEEFKERELKSVDAEILALKSAAATLLTYRLKVEQAQNFDEAEAATNWYEENEAIDEGTADYHIGFKGES